MTRSTIGSIGIRRTALFSTHHASAQDLVAGRERPFTPPAYALLIGRARARFTSSGHPAAYRGLRWPCSSMLRSRHRPSPCSRPVMARSRPPRKLLADFRETRTVSSARFAMSVHNTPAGIYSVAVGSTAPTTTVTGANAIAAGWLEAVLTVLELDRPVLFSIADESVPAVFQGPSEPGGRGGRVSAHSGGGRPVRPVAGRCSRSRRAPTSSVTRVTRGDQIIGLRVLGARGRCG